MKIKLHDWVTPSPEFIATLNDPGELEEREGQVVGIHTFGTSEIVAVEWEGDGNLGYISACYLTVLPGGGSLGA